MPVKKPECDHYTIFVCLWCIVRCHFKMYQNSSTSNNSSLSSMAGWLNGPQVPLFKIRVLYFILNH